MFLFASRWVQTFTTFSPPRSLTVQGGTANQRLPEISVVGRNLRKAGAAMRQEILNSRTDGEQLRLGSIDN